MWDYDKLSGSDLDMVGKALEVERLSAEMDETYRARVKAADAIRNHAKNSKAPESMMIPDGMEFLPPELRDAGWVDTAETLVFVPPRPSEPETLDELPSFSEDEAETGSNHTQIGVPPVSLEERVRVLQRDYEKAMGVLRETNIARRLLAIRARAMVGHIEHCPFCKPMPDNTTGVPLWMHDDAVCDLWRLFAET